MTKLIAGNPLSLITLHAPSRVEEIPIELIDRSRYQARSRLFEDEDKEVDESLAWSMKEGQLFYPLRVAFMPENRRYELISGHRRLEAAKKLGWETIKCEVYEKVNDFTLAYWVGMDNFQRVNWRPYEKGEYFHHLRDSFGMNLEPMARLFHLPPSTVQGWIDIAEAEDQLISKLDQEKQRMFMQNLTIRSEKALLKLSDVSDSQDDLLQAMFKVCEGRPDEEIEEYVAAAINALTRRGHRSKAQIREKAQKSMSPRDLDREIDSLVEKVKGIDSISNIQELTGPLQSAIDIQRQRKNEAEAKLREFEKMMKSSSKIKIGNTRMKVAHNIQHDTNSGECWHELPNGKKVCVKFALS